MIKVELKEVTYSEAIQLREELKKEFNDVYLLSNENLSSEEEEYQMGFLSIAKAKNGSHTYILQIGIGTFHS